MANEANQTSQNNSNTVAVVGQYNVLPGSIKPRHLAVATTQTIGDLYYGDGSGNFTRLGAGTGFLQESGAAPSWSNVHKVVAQTVTSYTPAAAATVTLDLSKGALHFITMPAGNITIAVSGVTVSSTTSQPFLVRIKNDASVRTITWFTTIIWSGSAAPTLTGSSKVDTFGFLPTSSGNYDGYVVGQNL